MIDILLRAAGVVMEMDEKDEEVVADKRLTAAIAFQKAGGRVTMTEWVGLSKDSQDAM